MASSSSTSPKVWPGSTVATLQFPSPLSRVMLGITIIDVTEEMSKQYSMPVGVYIREVSDFSAAQRAGLTMGDIIIEFAGEPVTCADDLNAIKSRQTPGDIVKVKVDRNSRTVELELVIPQPTAVETIDE